jgi:excisionase family DNA binding protein
MVIATDTTAGTAPPAGARAAADAALRPGSQLLYRVPEVVEMLGLSRSVVFELLRSGRLRSVTQGRARLIPASAVLDYVSLLEREAAQGTGD